MSSNIETLLRKIRQIFNPVFGLSAIFLLGLSGIFNIYTRTPAQSGSQSGGIQGFHLVSEDQGWLLFDQRLYWTQTGGQDWAEITPPGARAVALQAVFFLDELNGWVAFANSEDAGLMQVSIARTENGAAAWQIVTLPLPAFWDDKPPPAKLFLHFTDPHNGWLAVKHATGNNFSIGSLFATHDGGASWEERTLPIGEAVFFATTDLGWTAGGPRGDELYRTQDSGRTWQQQSVRASGIGEKLFYRLPIFENERQGVLPVILAQAGQAQFGFYETQDGGQTWQPGQNLVIDQEISSASDVPLDLLDNGGWAAIDRSANKVLRLADQAAISALRSRDSRLSGIGELDMATTDAGWAYYQSGECAPVEATQVESGRNSRDVLRCTSTSGLLRTVDGGGTWSALPLPGVAGSTNQGNLLVQETLVDASLKPVVVGPSSVQAGGQTMTMIGQGFDKCEIATPTQLQTWKASSPYRAVNLYVGGIHRACSNASLNATLINQLSGQGWAFIPTWVGPQAWCTDYTYRMSKDTTKAYNEGVNEADAAIAAMVSLGLTDANQSGTIIYYDLEYYDTTNATCREAARAFISGWTARLRARGNLAGVYSNGPPLSTFADIANVPDAIWPAHWIYESYNANATVWNVYSLSNSLWTNHQRIRQYAGGHPESWGGVSLNIDCDVIDGIVSVHLPLRTYFPVIRR